MTVQTSATPSQAIREELAAHARRVDRTPVHLLTVTCGVEGCSWGRRAFVHPSDFDRSFERTRNELRRHAAAEHNVQPDGLVP